MSVAGSVVVNLEAGTAEFSKNIAAGSDSLDGFGHHATEAMNRGKEFAESLNGMAEKLALLEGVKKGIEAIKEAFEEAAEIGRNALKLGIDPDDMSRLQHAANATHTDISSLTTGIDHLNVAIGKVINGDAGSEKAAASFKKLGLDVNELAALGPEKAFEKVSDALGHMGSQFKKADDQRELLGKGGRELTPIMEHLHDLMAESDEIGFTRSAADLKIVEEREREIAKITDTWKGLLMDIASSQILGSIVEKIRQAGEGWKIFLGGDGKNAVLSDMIEDLADNTAKLKAAQEGVGKAKGTDEALGAEQELFQLMNKRLELMEHIRRTGTNRLTTGAEIATMLQKETDYTGKIREENEKILALQKQSTAEHAQSKVDDSADKLLKKLKADVDSFGHSSTQKIVDDLVAMGASIDKINAAKKLSAQFDGLKKSQDDLKHVNDELDRMRKEVNDFGKSKEQIQYEDIVKLDPSKAGEAGQLRDQLLYNDALKERDKLMEGLATKAEKYASEMDKIDKLKAMGVLSDEQLKRLDDDAASRLLGEDKKEKKGKQEQSAEMMTRQFTFDLPNMNQNALAEPAKKTADLLTLIDQRQRQQASQFNDIWRYAQQIATGTTTNANLTVSIPLN